jgi:hypothetical protein
VHMSSVEIAVRYGLYSAWSFSMVGMRTRAENGHTENDNKDNQTGKCYQTIAKSKCRRHTVNRKSMRFAQDCPVMIRAGLKSVTTDIHQ